MEQLRYPLSAPPEEFRNSGDSLQQLLLGAGQAENRNAGSAL